ncbi:MAG: Asp-tRNA(Asn)/Glu-tRNA(Gln) amidotransferase subunit GatB [Candidatus Gracilibacteria bacterium]|jgi:aspartyl-tRNA(Asn)/glutamyl-tRNA(Gln) amidotransferase subunit B
MDFEAIIGLEIHAQMSTKTKMFCRCDNDSFGKEPNINVCPVCMGFPGQLPVVNEEAVKKGVKAALALNCGIPEYCKFDRKNYFYPDNPKGFQISQFDEPLSKSGYIEIDDDGKMIKIGITRLHLEDDAGKLTHVMNGSLVDFNRAGTPLMEIVSDPDIRTPEQAKTYAQEIQKILRYVGSSEADMEKGMMRFDASVSIRPKGDKKLYPRAEIKNLNSFKALETAIKYEISRQKQLWEDTENPLNGPVTVGWDDDKQETYFMRDKEESDDYRYFPEPDVPPLHLSKDLVDGLRKEVPELPNVKKAKYMKDMGITEEEALVIISDLNIANYFEEVVKLTDDVKTTASFLLTVLMKYLREDLISINAQKVTPKMMAELINMIKNGDISHNLAKGEIFEDMYKTGKSPSEIAKSKGIKQISDVSAIEAICKKIIDANPGPVNDVKSGKDKAIGFLIGQVMKEMKGQGNPGIVNEIMRKLL